MDISVVIGSYNQCNRLKKVIEGFASQNTQLQYEVIIVDSFSTDDTAQMVSQFNAVDLSFSLNFIQRENPAGKAEARNVGVHESKSDIIIITDADMIPDQLFVQSHYDAHKGSHSPVCFEGLAYNLDSYDWPLKTCPSDTQIPQKYTDGDRLDWYYFLTGNISFPKSLFLLENGFSVDFKSYGWEDLELGYRFKKRGVPLMYLQSAINYHYHVITPQERADRKFLMGQSAQIFAKKHPELSTFLGYNPLSSFIRRRLSKNHTLYKFILRLRESRMSVLHQFSFWFEGEFNYLSGLLNLSND